MNMRALVADDDPVCRRLLRDLIASWGFEVMTVNDGLEAMDVLRRADAPPLVVLDWNMPRMGGVEVCRAVRQRPGGDNTYILLVTASRNREEIMKVVVAGADDYLTKPFEPADLKIRLRTAVRIIHMQLELGARANAAPTTT
jgi:DNA-binding response OmpR family regulator